LQGALGTFTVVGGVEARIGRDGSRCEIILPDPRVSSLHASVKLESGQFYVRDENSNNGTTINGNRATAGQWMPVTSGSLLRFGAVEMSVRLE
jgi:pSer/pThr/pTyr-binding forkhead associated (FHA) protein